MNIHKKIYDSDKENLEVLIDRVIHRPAFLVEIELKPDLKTIENFLLTWNQDYQTIF